MKQRKLMSVELLAYIMSMHAAGKAHAEIADETGFSESAIKKYVGATKRAAAGEPPCGEDLHCKTDIINDYIKSVRKEVKGMSEVNCAVDIEKAKKILTELSYNTPITVIARLIGVSAEDVNRIQAYTKLLEDRENDKAIAYRKGGRFSPEVFDLMEKRAGFVPREKSKEEKDLDFRKELVSGLETVSALLDTVDDRLKVINENQITVNSLTEIMKILQGNVLAMTHEIQEMNKRNEALDKSVRMLANAVLNQKK